MYTSYLLSIISWTIVKITCLKSYTCYIICCRWGGVGHVLTFLWTCTWSYAVAVGWDMYSWVGGGGWGGIITSLALSHIRHATLLYVLLDFHTHTSCYATVRSLGLPHTLHATLRYVLLNVHTYIMLRYCTTRFLNRRRLKNCENELVGGFE